METVQQLFEICSLSDSYTKWAPLYYKPRGKTSSYFISCWCHLLQKHVWSVRNKNEALFPCWKNATWRLAGAAGAGELGVTMEVTPPCRVCAMDLVRVETKARSQLQSFCSFCPLRDQSLLTVGSEGWMPLDINCAMLQDVHEANLLFVPRQCRTGGHLGLHIRRAKEHSWGLGCFLDTTELDENVPFTTILYRFFPLPFLSGVSFPWNSFSRGAQSSVQEVNCFPLSDFFRQTFCAFTFKRS